MSLRVTSEIGKLKSVLVHLPGPEIDRMVPSMMEELLFDDILYGNRAREEHRRFQQVLGYVADEVLEIQDLLEDVLTVPEQRSAILDDLGKTLGWGPDMLTEYFTLASDAIFACGGTIDKFIGDAVMAFFGAPLDQPDHAERAVDAALRIREGVAGWNRSRAERGEPPLEVRIALNTGEAIVGDIGSERRVDYTVLGNAVNVAARMEEFVAGPGEIVIGPATYDATRLVFRVVQMGHFALKGLSTQVPMYKVLSKISPEETLDIEPAKRTL